MRIDITLLIIAAVSMFGCSTTQQKTVQSDVALPIAKKYSCMACHAIDRKIVGPSFNDVARKYRGQNVQQTLFTKVRNGSNGVWGVIPKPPMSHIPENDLQTVIIWITELWIDDRRTAQPIIPPDRVGE